MSDDKVQSDAALNQAEANKASGVPVASFTNFCQLPFAALSKKLQRTRPTWVFHHIPKTAGSSLVDELQFCFPPYFNIGAAAAKYASDESQPDKLMGGVDEFITSNASAAYASVSGHLRPVHVRKLIHNVPNIALFTFLREPVARYVSEYRYVKTPKHPKHVEARNRYPTIDDYVADVSTHNTIWKFIAGGQSEATEDMIEKHMRKYAFVGTLEDFHLTFEFLTALTGHPKTPSSRNNVTEKRGDNDVEMTADLRQKVEAAHQADIAVYNYVVRHLTARREEMVQFVEERRLQYAGATF